MKVCQLINEQDNVPDVLKEEAAEGANLSDRIQMFSECPHEPKTLRRVPSGSGFGVGRDGRPCLYFQGLAENRVLKTGLLELEQRIGQPDIEELLRFPRWPNGSPMMLSESFFLRLLSGAVEFRSCMGADVAGAQRDLRRLTLPQLIATRNRCLGFATESCTHQSHREFVETMDRFLFEHIAKRGLRGPEPSCPLAANRLGMRLVLVLGAIAEMPALSQLPSPFWAIPLVSDWGADCEVAIFNASEIWTSVGSADPQDTSEVLHGQTVNVISEQSVCQGPTHELSWEISSLDPVQHNLLEEMDKVLETSDARSHIQGELSAVLKLRGRVEEGYKTSVSLATTKGRRSPTVRTRAARAQLGASPRVEVCSEEKTFVSDIDSEDVKPSLEQSESQQGCETLPDEGGEATRLRDAPPLVHEETEMALLGTPSAVHPQDLQERESPFGVCCCGSRVRSEHSPPGAGLGSDVHEEESVCSLS